MNGRIKVLRKTLELNQTEFGTKIRLTTGAVSDIERGKVKNITDRVVNDICREFNVNENWLRTGEGEMFIPVNEAVKQTAVLLGKRDPEFEQLIDMYSKLNDKNKKLFVELGKTLLKND